MEVSYDRIYMAKEQFKSLEIAKMYLRTADYSVKKHVGFMK